MPNREERRARRAARLQGTGEPSAEKPVARKGRRGGAEGRRVGGGALRGITVSQVAANIHKVLRRQYNLLNRMIYANQRGFTSTQIFTALGGADTTAVIQILEQCQIFQTGSGSGG